MTEADRLQLLCEIFGWDTEEETLFHALCILRRATGQPEPSWDDFHAKVSRQ